MAGDDRAHGGGDTYSSVGGQAHVEHLVQVGYVGTFHHHLPEPSVRRPVQLQPVPAHFKNHENEQRLILDSVRARGDGGGPFVAALRGFRGVGKTTSGAAGGSTGRASKTSRGRTTPRAPAPMEPSARRRPQAPRARQDRSPTRARA